MQEKLLSYRRETRADGSGDIATTGLAGMARRIGLSVAQSVGQLLHISPLWEINDRYFMNSFNCSQFFGRPGRRLSRSFLAAGVLYASAAGVALAQDADGDVISLTAGIGLLRDSNVLRIVDGGTVPAAYGTDKRGDLSLRGSLGITFDRMISQQRLQASAEVLGAKYREYDDFDNIGYRAGVNYNWVIGRPLFGLIGVRASRIQPEIQDRLLSQPGASRNDIDNQAVTLNGGFRFTPSWSVIAGVELERWRNSSRFYEDADQDHKTVEAGVRYAPGTGAEFDLVYRRTDGEYKHDRLFADDGSVLLVPGQRNDFKQNALVARVAYKPSEDSRVAGHVGYTRREYERVATRDFSGLTTGFDIEWAQTGALQWRVGVTRDIVPDDNALTATYADARGIRVAPVIQATGKIKVLPVISYTDYRYEGNVAATQQRKDKLKMYGVTVDYEIRRNLFAALDLRREERDSSLNFLDFTANIIGIGLRARF